MTSFISSTDICFLTCGIMLFLKKLSASNHSSRNDGSLSISLNEGLAWNDWLRVLLSQGSAVGMVDMFSVRLVGLTIGGL